MNQISFDIDYMSYRQGGIGHLVLLLSKLEVINLYTVDVVWSNSSSSTLDDEMPVSVCIRFRD